MVRQLVPNRMLIIVFLSDSIISDIDECAQNSHTCDINANCKNTVGSYDCQCHQGYSGNGNTCTGIDTWCLQNNDIIYVTEKVIAEKYDTLNKD